MCQHHVESASFLDFCVDLRRQLVESPLLDPPLAAALELLERRVTWFECEVSHLAFNAEDMHASLGAGVLLSLWNGHLRELDRATR